MLLTRFLRCLRWRAGHCRPIRSRPPRSFVPRLLVLEDRSVPSTFTVTSLGRDGGLLATPVVKHPEVAILGVHRIKEYAKPVRLSDGQVKVEIAERMNLSCSFDC